MRRSVPVSANLQKRFGGERIAAIYVTVAMVLIALVSATVLSGFFSSTKTYTAAFEKLDEKRDTVIALTAASATASAALTLIPDDTCTPIATQLSQISKDFTFVVAALLLEKYLLTTIGFVFFTIIVPICCLLFAASRFAEARSLSQQALTQAAFKLFAFGLVLFIATPASVFITSKIDETYKDSIEATVKTANEVTKVIEEVTQESERTNPENPLEFLQQRLEDLQSTVSNVGEAAKGALEWVKQLLGSFVEAFAVMLVTSIVIPILVPLVIYLAFKLLCNQQLLVVQQNTLPPAATRNKANGTGPSRVEGTGGTQAHLEPPNQDEE